MLPAAGADTVGISRLSPTRPDPELLTAWVLLLLAGGESHGYDLSRRLGDVSLTVQPSALYRRLRLLEQEGSVASHWGSPVAGPRRRLYSLTGEGRRDLGELARRIGAYRGALSTFLRAHHDARRLQLGEGA